MGWREPECKGRAGKLLGRQGQQALSRQQGISAETERCQLGPWENCANQEATERVNKGIKERITLAKDGLIFKTYLYFSQPEDVFSVSEPGLFQFIFQ